MYRNLNQCAFFYVVNFLLILEFFPSQGNMIAFTVCIKACLFSRLAAMPCKCIMEENIYSFKYMCMNMP